VLLATHNFPRHAADMAGAFLLALAQGQAALGHEVQVVAPHAPGLPLDDTIGGVRVRRFRYGPDAAETLAYAGTMHEQVLRSWRARARLLRFLLAFRHAVRAAVRDFQPLVLHVHWWFPGGLTVWPRRGLPRALPVVLTSHGTDLFLLDRFRAARILAARVFAQATEVTVISSPLAPRVRALGVPHDRVTVVPMPLDAAAFPAAPSDGRREADLILFVGRLVERKGAEFALRALAQARGQTRARLVVAGDGPERPALERLAAELHVQDRVTFTGMLPPHDVAAWYRRAAVLVFPAVTDWKGEQEGFGMVLVEAMRSGLPIVATRSGGIPDVIADDATGLLVPERDPAALGAALQRVLDDAPLARRLADTAQADVQRRFAPARIAQTFAAVYARAAARAA
jgi:glycosyltransferase involved in cell wall biosynthesis